MDQEDKNSRRKGGAGHEARKSNRWTKRKKQLFLDHFAATCNVAQAAAIAGMSEGSLFALRRKDADFAQAWDAALDAARIRLEAMLIERAQGGRDDSCGRPAQGKATEQGASPDIDLALQLLKFHQGGSLGQQRRTGTKRRRATREETDAAILKKLKVLRKRMGEG